MPTTTEDDVILNEVKNLLLGIKGEGSFVQGISRLRSKWHFRNKG